MSKEILFGDWLQPSVSQKRMGDGKSKILKRNLLGSKGIGRLAAMALGRYLSVFTKIAETDEYSWLVIDREDFKQETLLSNINFPGGFTSEISQVISDTEVRKKKNGIYNNQLLDYLAKSKLLTFTEGTLIVVELLDDSIRAIIEEEFVNGDVLLENMSLVRALRILITPLFLNAKIQNELINKNLLENKLEISLPESIFEINFGSNLLDRDIYPKGYIQIEEFEILANYDYRILGKIGDDGTLHGVYTCNRLIEDSFEVKFELTNDEIFSEESFRKRNFNEIVNRPKRNTVGEFFFDLRIYDRDPDAMDRLSKILKTNGRREAAYFGFFSWTSNFKEWIWSKTLRGRR